MTIENGKVKIPPPPRKTIGKGAPPPVQEASKNLSKPMEEDDVPFNFNVPSEFRKRVRQYALDHNTSAKRVMMEALEEYLEKNG